MVAPNTEPTKNYKMAVLQKVPFPGPDLEVAGPSKVQGTLSGQQLIVFVLFTSCPVWPHPHYQTVPNGQHT